MKMTKLTTMVLAIASLVSCGTNEPKQETETTTQMQKIEPADTAAWVSLTVAESKKLIAKGLIASEKVQAAMNNAAVVIARGSTNHYILEELMGQQIEDGSFLTGRISPTGKPRKKVQESKNEYVYQDGKLREVESFEQELSALPKGSIIFKGGNILNCSANKAAVLVGNPTGGTIGMIGRVLSDDIELIIPIGLEKDSSVDIDFMAANFGRINGKAPAIHILRGMPFTEINAIKAISPVEVYHYASGGVDGAEGGVSLLLRGNKADVDKAIEFVKSVHGEPAFFSDKK